MSSTVNVALAGIAGYGDAYLDALLHHPRAAGTRLVGVADPASDRCERLAELKRRAIPIYPNLETLLAEVSIDLMMIVTPIHLHASHTCLALEHGANVLCEKPLASALADAMRMAECERRSGRFVGIGYQWSFSDAVQELKRDIMDGVLGRPIRMKTIAFFPRGMQYFRRNDWVGRLRTSRGETVLDSPVNNATAHYLHNMLYLLGSTRVTSSMPVKVQAELYRANTIENYDTAALRVITDQDIEILFYTTHAAAQQLGPVCRCEFESAVVEYDAGNGPAFVARFHDGRIRNYGAPNLDRHQKLWQCIETARSGETVPCGIGAALAHTLCVLAAQESTRVIATFPEAMRRVIPRESDFMVEVEGLSRALRECYEYGILPHEHGGFDWSVPAAVVRVRTPRHDAPTPSVQTFVASSKATAGEQVK